MPIRDMGYKPYEGDLLSHKGRYWTIARRGLQQAWASKVVKIILLTGLGPMLICGAIMYLQLKLKSIAGGNIQIDLEDANELVFILYFWCQLWFSFALSQRLGAPAIADDVRTGAFSFYFSRPVSRVHYVLGKILPVALLVGIVSTLPALLLCAFRLALASDGDDAWHALRTPLATLGLTPFYLGLFAALPVCLGSLTSRSRAVQYIWAGVFFFSWIMGGGIATAAEEPMIALVSLPTNLLLIGQHLYGIEPDFPIPIWYPMAVLTGVIALGIWLLWRRLERVEIFT